MKRIMSSADVIVVDPPRKGCDEICLDTIVKMAAGTGGVCKLRLRHAGKRFEISVRDDGYELREGTVL